MKKFEKTAIRLMELLETTLTDYTFKVDYTNDDFALSYIYKDGELFNAICFADGEDGSILIKSYILVDFDAFDNKEEFMSLVRGLVDDAPDTEWLYLGETVDLFDTGRETWEMKPTRHSVYENDEKLIEEMKQAFKDLELFYARIADYNKAHNGEKIIVFLQGEHWEE